MANELSGKRIAILVENGFEQSEMAEPRAALERAGAKTVLVSPQDGQVKGWTHGEWGDSFVVDLPLDQARAEDFDGLLLTGGVINPDKLRIEPQAVAFVKAFLDAGMPVAAICHGPWTLIEAGGVRGRRMTSWPSLRTDLVNAGADWVDEQVVSDRGVTTSRKPDDLPAFSRRIIEEYAKGRGARRQAA
jgi:protease I